MFTTSNSKRNLKKDYEFEYPSLAENIILKGWMQTVSFKNNFNVIFYFMSSFKRTRLKIWKVAFSFFVGYILVPAKQQRDLCNLKSLATPLLKFMKLIKK